MGWQQGTGHAERKMHVSAVMVTQSGNLSLVTDL
jgi:hypothetical protein